VLVAGTIDSTSFEKASCSPISFFQAELIRKPSTITVLTEVLPLPVPD